MTVLFISNESFCFAFCCLLLPVCADDTWLPNILNNPSGLWWNVAYQRNSTWHREWTTNCTNWFASGHVNCVRVVERSFGRGKVTASALCHRTQPSHKLAILCAIDWPQPSQLAIQFNWLTCLSFFLHVCSFPWTLNMSHNMNASAVCWMLTNARNCTTWKKGSQVSLTRWGTS